MLLNTAIISPKTQHCVFFVYIRQLKMVNMFEISTVSATGVRCLVGVGA